MSGLERAERDAGGLPFADEARRLLEHAEEASRGLNHVYVGTEHLVLALARRPAAAGLERLGVDWERIRARVAEIVAAGAPEPAGRVRPATPAVLPHTSRTSRALALAGESARALGHAEVGVGHLLLGVVRERTGVGAAVLAEQGLTEEAAAALARGPDTPAG